MYTRNEVNSDAKTGGLISRTNFTGESSPVFPGIAGKCSIGDWGFLFFAGTLGNPG